MERDTTKTQFQFFITSQAIIYLLFLLIDFLNISQFSFHSCLLKYLGIIGCFLFVSREHIIIKTALFFTLFADYFLIFTDDYLIGVCFFILVQLTYCFYFSDANLFHVLRSCLIAFVGTCIITVLALFLFDNVLMYLDVLSLVAIFYYLLLLQNVFYAFLTGHNLLAVGLILMALCDLNVGICNIENYVSSANILLSSLIAASNVLMWFFYLPSQVLIALSFHKPQSSCIFWKDLV